MLVYFYYNPSPSSLILTKTKTIIFVNKIRILNKFLVWTKFEFFVFEQNLKFEQISSLNKIWIFTFMKNNLFKICSLNIYKKFQTIFKV
jgi:hypothetical protein